MRGDQSRKSVSLAKVKNEKLSVALTDEKKYYRNWATSFDWGRVILMIMF